MDTAVRSINWYDCPKSWLGNSEISIKDLKNGCSPRLSNSTSSNSSSKTNYVFKKGFTYDF